MGILLWVLLLPIILALLGGSQEIGDLLGYITLTIFFLGVLGVVGLGIALLIL